MSSQLSFVFVRISNLLHLSKTVQTKMNIWSWERQKDEKPSTVAVSHTSYDHLLDCEYLCRWSASMSHCFYWLWCFGIYCGWVHLNAGSSRSETRIEPAVFQYNCFRCCGQVLMMDSVGKTLDPTVRKDLSQNWDRLYLSLMDTPVFRSVTVNTCLDWWRATVDHTNLWLDTQLEKK